MESVALLWWMTLFGPCKGIHRDMACCIPRGFQVRARKWKSGGSLVLPLGDIHIRRFLLISFSVKVVNKDWIMQGIRWITNRINQAVVPPAVQAAFRIFPPATQRVDIGSAFICYMADRKGFYRQSSHSRDHYLRGSALIYIACQSVGPVLYDTLYPFICFTHSYRYLTYETSWHL